MAVKKTTKKKVERVPLVFPKPSRGTGKTHFKTHKINCKPNFNFTIPQKDKACYITEFEVIMPQHKHQKVGDRFILSKYGMYCDEGNVHNFYGHNLLYMFDHTDNFRISKIVMNGNQYVIPKDRVKNYERFIGDSKSAPDLNKLIEMKRKAIKKIESLNEDQMIMLLHDMELLNTMKIVKFKVGKQ